MAAIGVYIGVNLMPGLNTTIATITTPTYSAGVAGLTGVILIVFAAMKHNRGFAEQSASNNASNSGEAKLSNEHANRRAKQKAKMPSGNVERLDGAHPYGMVV